MTFREAILKARDLDSVEFRVYNDDVSVEFYHGMVYFDGVEIDWDDNVEIPLRWIMKDDYKVETGINI